MAQQWHREYYAGVRLPVPYYAGEFRDTDQSFPQLMGYEVGVGSSPGVASALVPSELDRFLVGVEAAIGNLDAAIPAGAPYGTLSAPQLEAILRLAAIVHGEWVRIHPFANGNGRTARVWANWVASRYGLPAFVTLKPRPAGTAYGGAALDSMRGDHLPMFAFFNQLLQDYMAQTGP